MEWNVTNTYLTNRMATFASSPASSQEVVGRLPIPSNFNVLRFAKRHQDTPNNSRKSRINFGQYYFGKYQNVGNCLLRVVEKMCFGKLEDSFNEFWKSLNMG